MQKRRSTETKEYASVNGTALVYDGNGNMTRDALSRHITHGAENVSRIANDRRYSTNRRGPSGSRNARRAATPTHADGRESRSSTHAITAVEKSVVADACFSRYRCASSNLHEGLL